MDIKDSYFFTLDNINEYSSEDVELTDEELKKRVLNNYNLCKSNKSIEKKLMYLNNCLINFDKFKEDVPFDLYFLIYNDLISLSIISKKLEDANNYLNILYDRYNNLNETDKNKYCDGILNLFINLIYLGDELSNYEMFFDNLNIIKAIYSENKKTDSLNLLFSKACALYSKLLFLAKSFDDSIKVEKKAYNLVKGISDDNIYKNDSLASITFSLGNISFQADYYEDAEKYFIEAIKLCSNNEFNSKFEVNHLSYNYLSQLYVYTQRYDAAIKTLIDYILLFKNKYNGDDHLYVCGDFYYRIGIIYYKFKEDESTSQMYFKYALEALNKIENKNDDVIEYINDVNDLLK